MAGLPPGHSYRLGPGAVLSFQAARSGARAYVAVDGGFTVAPVLGSRSTDHRSGFGGLDGRPLRAGDVLLRGEPGPADAVGRRCGASTDQALAFIAIDGSQVVHPSAVRAFCTTEWQVAADSDEAASD